MNRFVLRQRVNEFWNYVLRDGSVCSDVLEAAKFQTLEDLIKFALDNNLPKGTVIEEISFSYVAEPV